MASSQVGNISISRTDAQKLNYFLKKAAKNGSANACMSLADCYEKGINGIQGYKEALKLV